MRARSFVPILATALFVAACSESPVGPEPDAVSVPVAPSNAEASCELVSTGGPISTPVGTYSYSTYSCPTWMHAQSKAYDLESGGITDCSVSGSEPWRVSCETYLGEGFSAAPLIDGRSDGYAIANRRERYG